jgi:hypothetical protein
MRVTIASPPRQAQVEKIIQVLEDGFTDDGTIVSAPADNHGIELLDEVVLTGHSILPNDRAELRIVSFDGRTAGFDESLEVVFSIILAYRILAHLEPQEVKPGFATFWLEGVRNAGLRRVKGQAELLQPLCHKLSTLFNDRALPV